VRHREGGDSKLDGGAPVVLFGGGGFLNEVEVMGEVRRMEEQQENGRGGAHRGGGVDNDAHLRF
jgi:hypothetical protein